MCSPPHQNQLLLAKLQIACQIINPFYINVLLILYATQGRQIADIRGDSDGFRTDYSADVVLADLLYERRATHVQKACGLCNDTVGRLHCLCDQVLFQ